MKPIKTILTAIGLSALSIQIAFAQSTYRELSTRDKVIGYAKHINLNNIKRVKYAFDVVNNSPYTIYGIEVGEKSVTDNEPAIDFGDDDSRNFIYTSPMTNWLATAEWLPESYNFSFTWTAPSVPETYNKAEFLLANKTHTGFSVTTFKRYPTIWSTFVELKIYEPVNHQIIKLTKGDTVKPTGSVNATVAATPLKPGFYTATIKVKAKDNYDPLPEIALTAVKEVSSGTVASPFSGSSYTVNTPNNATTGAYPTAITFKADVKVAKSYQLTYTITDASDNKTEVFTTITIPATIAVKR